MTSEELRQLALFGAKARLLEIDQERERLLEAFPELGREGRKPRPTTIQKAAGPRVIFDAAAEEPSAPTKRKIGRPPKEATERASAIARKLIENGATLGEIEAGTGRGKSWIYRFANSQGLTIAVNSKMGTPHDKKRWRSVAKGQPGKGQGGNHRTWRERRSHTEEFKAKALARLKAGEYLSDVSSELDIVPNLLRTWAQKAKVKYKAMPASEIQRRRALTLKKNGANGVTHHNAVTNPVSEAS